MSSHPLLCTVGIPKGYFRKTYKRGPKFECPGVLPGYKGQWRAQIHINGRKRYLGTFRTREQAIEARKQAEKIYHSHYLNGGR